MQSDQCFLRRYYGPRQAQTNIRACAKCAGSHYPAHAQPHPGICSPLKHTYSIQWFCLLVVKVLIRLRRCASWSGPLLSTYVRRYVFAWRGTYSYYRNEFYFTQKLNKVCRLNINWWVISPRLHIDKFHKRKMHFLVPTRAILTLKMWVN